MNRFAVLTLLAPLAAAVGCAPGARPSAAPAAALGKSAGADVDLGQRENARGVDLLHARKYGEAEAALKAALAADPANGPAHNNLGTAYFRQTKYYLAAWEYQYAAKLMPRHAEPRNNLGLVFEQVGKLDDAVQWYGRAIELGSDNPEFVGNLTRARVRRGDDGEKVRALLEKIASTDLRPEWVGWAKERLALRRAPATRAAEREADGASPDGG